MSAPQTNEKPVPVNPRDIAAIVRQFIRSPIRHAELSAICSLDDDVKPSPRLLDVAIKTAARAAQSSLAGLAQAKAAQQDNIYYDIFPGEHYRFLNALVAETKAQHIIEIGTFTGMGTAALRYGIAPAPHVTTFDIIPWQKFPTHLTEVDFAGGGVVQVLADLSQPEAFMTHHQLFAAADIIFIDGPKDNAFEAIFLTLMQGVTFKPNCILVIDDIRVLSMIDTWRSIKSPKLDITSFGHWSGTGLVDVGNGLVFSFPKA